VSQVDEAHCVRYHKLRQWVIDDKVINLVKVSTKHIGIMENELKGRNHYLDVTIWLSLLLFQAYMHSFIYRG